jgi:zinc transport system substrate-binding protein
MRYTISLLAASTALAPPAMAEVPQVVTDIPPVHALVAQVMGDLGQPVLLLERGANAHDFQLKPSQIAALSEADLVVWIGPAMTPWLDRALETAEGAQSVTLLDAPGTELRRFGAADPHDHAEDDHGHGTEGAKATEAGGEHDHDHGHDEHAHDEHAEEGHHHEHTGTDPHAWLDPANAQAWLRLIADRLGEADPGNAATYTANAEAASARIASLDVTLAARLEPLHDRPFVVFHDAYGYFADHYDLSIAGAIALGDAASPGAAHLTELRATMQAGTPLCIFPEANHDPKLVATMVEGSGARIGAPLDPEGALLDPGPGLYDALLTGLADALTGCLAES